MFIHSQILKARARKWHSAPAADVPTVCVGNVTVGGTGKTPHTEYILRTLLHSARPIAMLSRGYKRKSKGFQYVQQDSSAAFAGDEPLQIKKKFPQVSVAVCKNRVQACLQIAGDGASVIVLDDAFQYNKLHANLNIVLVDYNRPVFDDALLPFGRLRDLPERIFEADAVIVSKCPQQMTGWEKTSFAQQLRFRSYMAAQCEAEAPSGKRMPLLFSSMVYGEPKPVFPEADARYNYSQGVVVFSAIADDTPLRDYLSDKYRICKALSFPDHHRFTRANIRAIAAQVKRNPTAALITTEKDAQRILDAPRVPESIRTRLFYLPIEVKFESEEEAAALEKMLGAL